MCVRKSLKLVLLAFDENRTAQAIIDLLAEHGYSVIHVSTGEEALGLVQDEPHAFALVCANIVMPHLDGFELQRIVRNDPTTAHVPVILLTYPPNESDSWIAWNAKKPRFYVSDDGRDAAATVHDGHDLRKLNRADILGCVDAVYKRASEVDAGSDQRCPLNDEI